MSSAPLPDTVTGNAGRRNLLLITYSFPPFGGVGVYRALSLAKYLPALGWNVHVLTAKNPSAVGTDTALLSQVPESVTIHRTLTLDLPFQVKKAIKKFAGKAGASPAPDNSRPQSWKSSLLARVKDLLSPDPQVLWLPFAIRAAVRIVAAERIDVVLVTVPPFSSLRIGVAVKKRFPYVALVSDFRDEWLTYYFHTLGYNRSDAALRGAVEIEKSCVEASDRVVAVTERARLEMRNRYPGQPDSKFQLIGNGYEPAIFRNFRARPNLSTAVLLGYAGTVYAPSDPTEFAEALDLLPAAVRSVLRICFIGHVENPEYRALLEGQAPVVRLDGFLPQAEAMQALEQMDFLLLIWNDAINIPGKVYDYLGTGKPIIAFVDPEGEVWRLITATRTGWCADVSNPRDIARLLTQACADKPALLAQYAPDREAVARCERARRAAAYSALLEGIFT